MNIEKIGRIAFYIGLIISVAAGFVAVGALGLAALVVLGVVIGLLNITGAEVHRFLLSTIALMLTGSVLSAIPALGGFVTDILLHFTAFVAGAALVVALREVWEITKKK